ncbi:Pyridoxal phosphate-dependent aminotransferase [Candidatus Bealeia paramacronuclearis]|uniref:Aminotransferase n=1 Tax=Candidatus Bealeia paramacronuclearis TaxID=1921001 RepID=A0ABZ2C572_9PROT|nr:Pyridoxal phosphate-dependent aminotransferase [Candidatus Bealeia paramacronuclearis]
MSLLAKRMQLIKPSPTLAVTQKAAELRAEGKDVIDLGVGEPDFPTPLHIIEEAYAAMKRGETRYTAVSGTVNLRKAICEKFRRENNLDYTPDEVIVSAGAKHVLFEAFFASLNPGDEVIIPAPYWVSYPDMVSFAEGHPVFVKCDDSQDFKITPLQLDKVITPKTKWLILNSPSNPTGMAYSKEELAALGEVLKKHPHVYIMSDDIYEHLLFEGRAFATIAQVVPELKLRTLTVNGTSKAYSMTGWRIGYAAGPKDIIKAMTTLQSQSTSNACSIAQAATIAALAGPTDFIAERTKAFQERRDRALEIFSTCPDLKCIKPQGAFYLFPNCAGVIGKKTPQGQIISTDMDYANYLLEEAGVAVVPGTAFGLSPYFRLSTATALNVLENACTRIVAATGRLQG